MNFLFLKGVHELAPLNLDFCLRSGLPPTWSLEGNWARVGQLLFSFHVTSSIIGFDVYESEYPAGYGFMKGRVGVYMSQRGGWSGYYKTRKMLLNGTRKRIASRQNGTSKGKFILEIPEEFRIGLLFFFYKFSKQ